MGKVIDKNGFWLINKNPITKVGVFPYLGKQISQDCEPNKIYYVLRPKKELFKQETLDSLKNLPLVDEHTMLGRDYTPAEKKGVDGVLGEQVEHDDDTIYTNIKIFSEDMKEKIREGKKELSLGYFCTYDKQEGTYKGQRYDFVQKNIIGNHLALVDKGRMGSDVRVYDKAIENKVYCCDSLEGIDIEKMEYKKAEEKGKMAEEKKKVEANDEDKRKLIDEIGGMCKEAGMSEEQIRTIIGKAEKIAYNASEESKADDEDAEKKAEKKDEEKKSAKDKCGKDEEKGKKEEGKDEEEKKEEKKGISEDEMFELIAKRDELAKGVEKVIGTFDYSKMSTKQVAKYACDKLEIEAEEGQEVSAVQGYLKGVEKQQKVVVKINSAQDSINDSSDTDFEEYMQNSK